MCLFSLGTVATADCAENVEAEGEEDDDSEHCCGVFMVIVQRYGVLESR